MSSTRLKFISAALGEFVGSRACMKAFSFSESQEAVEGTEDRLERLHFRERLLE